MPIAYSASTSGATFLLDEQGVCRRVLLKRASSSETPSERSRHQAAKLVVGAQYVASIDTRVEGGLLPMPRPGAALLFAYADESGRLAVVRTAPLVRFETVATPDDTVPVPDLDDECMTIPLHQSGERATPRWLFEPLPENAASAHDRATRDNLDDTLEAPPPAFRASWPRPPLPTGSAGSGPVLPARGGAEHNVRLRKISIMAPSEVAPTQKFERTPLGKGMLPKKVPRPGR